MNKKNTHRQIQSITPEPFSHWTIKEIYEQVDSSLRAISLGGRLMSTNEVKLGGLDMNKHILSKIEHFFTHYKDNETEKWVKVKGFKDRDYAIKIYEAFPHSTGNYKKGAKKYGV